MKWLLIVGFALGAVYFAYRASTSVIYRLTGLNFRIENLANLHDAIVNADDRRKFQNVTTFFLDQAASYMRFSTNGEFDRLTEVYAKHANDFLPVRAVDLKTFCAPINGYLRDRGYLQYGARLAVLPDVDGDALPDLLGVSYLGHDEHLHQNQHFSSYLPSRHFGPLDGSVFRSEKDSGLFKQFLTRKSYLTLVAGSYLRPFGYNAGDFDGDGASDFILGDELYLSSAIGFGEDGTLKTGAASYAEVPVDSVFLRRGGQSALVSYAKGRLMLRTWDAAAKAPQVVGEQVLEPDLAASERPYQVLPLPDLDGDGGDEFAVKDGEDLQLYVVAKDGSFRPTVRLTGLPTLQGHMQVGGFGDFDRDGAVDFWIVQSGFLEGSQRIGRALLITAQALKEHIGKSVPVSEVADLTLLGSTAYTRDDGIGVTLSLEAGDIDGDGRPDLSITGHHQMDESGALFVLLGKDVQPGLKLDVADPRVLKVRGNELSQLAPPPVHWDASDYDGDGYDDIVVTADNDFCSGFATGAIHILSGRMIMDGWQRLSATAPDASRS